MTILLLIIFLQVILESMPVSSSGHMALFFKFLKFDYPFYIDFFLHGPTILVLIIVFYKQWFFPVSRLLRGMFNKDMMRKKINLFFYKTATLSSQLVRRSLVRRLEPPSRDPVIKKSLYKDSSKNLLKIFFKIIKLIFVSNFITIIIYFLVETFFKKQVWFSSDITLLFGFGVTMLLLFSLTLNVSTLAVPAIALRDGWVCSSELAMPAIAFGEGRVCSSEKKGFEKELDISDLGKFIILGLVQGLALLPGISRFASVYATARLLQVSTRRAFEITFLLQFPLIVAAFFLGFYKMTRVTGWSGFFSAPVSLSIIVATIISVIVLFWCKRLANNKKMWRFAFYMFFPISVLILSFVF